MAVFCLILGIICVLYYVLLVIRAGIMVNFGWFWLVAGAGFLLAALLRRCGQRPAALWTSRLILAGLAAVFVLIGIFSIQVISGMHPSTPDSLEYVIVLGAQVRGKNPSLALAQRIDKALETAQQNPDLTLILSGGQGRGEEISEAQCMWNELTKAGVDENRLILEDKSTSTRENLVFSDRLCGCAKKTCGILSNDFHLYRALKLARKLGYEDVYGIAGESEVLMKPHYIVREAAALLKQALGSGGAQG